MGLLVHLPSWAPHRHHSHTSSSILGSSDTTATLPLLPRQCEVFLALPTLKSLDLSLYRQSLQ